MVVVNDFKTAKDIAFDPRMSSRPDNYFAKYIRGSEGRSTGILATSGDVWKTCRKFSMTTLKGG
jgi:hypothetical protein